MVFPSFGNYPKEYNRAVHGPFYPWVNYSAKKDIPLKDVKLGELQAWLMRRNKTPQAAIAATSRAFFRWQYRWMHTRYGSAIPAFVQFMSAVSFLTMLTMIPYLRKHRLHKYHW